VSVKEPRPRLRPTGPPASVTAMAKDFRVECPCCKATLTVDPDLKAIVTHEPPPRQRSVSDLDVALGSLKTRSAALDEKFRRELEAQGDKGKLLDRKFQEGLKKAKDSPGPPKRPFDYE
jgi:hypothetical protein